MCKILLYLKLYDTQVDCVLPQKCSTLLSPGPVEIRIREYIWQIE